MTSSEWINKTEAAARLKISERSVLLLAAKGAIKSKKERAGKTNQIAVQFLAADVERYGFERDNQETMKALHRFNEGNQECMKAVLALPGNPAHSNTANGLALSYQSSNIPPILAHHTRGTITERHSTEHYRIKEWIHPAEDSPFFKFVISGPGAEGQVYIATSESCGPHQIRALESAFRAGMQCVNNGPRDWLKVDEAALSTGLPATAILCMIEAGKLPAIDLDNGQSRKGGGRVGGRYRVSRKDLDALQGERVGG